MVDGPDDIKHVLIVGCPRSGTTLLQSIIAAHPSVFSSPETHFFADSVGQRTERMFRMPAASWREKGSRIKHRFRVALGMTNYRACRTRLVAFLTYVGRADLVARVPARPRFLGLATRLYLSLGKQIARQQGKTVWLEKTPDHLHYLETICRYIPDAKVICVVRSGPDNVASLFDVARKYKDRWHVNYWTIDGCINRWLSSARDASRQSGRRNLLLVSYEDMTADPERQVARVCDFIGLSYDNDMIDRHGGVYQQIVRDREPHKSNIKEKIESRNGEKFQELFTAVEQAHIISRLGDWPDRMRALCR